MADLCCCC